MTAFPRTRGLFDDLARTLGVPSLAPEPDGGLALTVADETVRLFPDDDARLLIVVPVGALPPEPGYALTLWLLRRNFLDSDLGQLRVAADAGGGVVIWGRVPLGRLDGAKLAGLLHALAAEAEALRGQLGEVAGEA